MRKHFFRERRYNFEKKNLLEGNNQSFVEPKVKQNILVRNTIDIFIVPRTWVEKRSDIPNKAKNQAKAIV